MNVFPKLGIVASLIGNYSSNRAMLHRNNKGTTMNMIDIPQIEREARALRAKEIQRLQNLFAERLSLYTVLLGNSLLSLLVTAGELVRPLLTWNPQATSLPNGSALLARLNRGARALFSWNPQNKRSA